MATAADHEAAVLLWNYSDAAQPENAGKLTPVAVALSGIPVGVNRVQVREFRIDDTHSNAYTVWQAMGSPQHPTAQQYADLKKRDGLEALDDGKWLQVANRQVTIQTLLPRQSVSLLQVRYDN
jgi:xylan 1,4-beta-xylosidase